MKKELYFAPMNIVFHFRKYIEVPDGTPSKRFRKAKELFHVAVMLVGRKKMEGKEYYAQLIDDKEQFPDARTLLKPQNIDHEEFQNWPYQDVEVVSYTPNSAAESLSDFLQRTKLKNGYDELTTILCCIETKKMLSSDDWKEVINGVNESTDMLVYILGRTSQEKENWFLFEGNTGTSIHFNLVEELNERGHTGVEPAPSLHPNLYQEGERHCAFDDLGDLCLCDINIQRLGHEDKP